MKIMHMNKDKLIHISFLFEYFFIHNFGTSTKITGIEAKHGKVNNKV